MLGRKNSSFKSLPSIATERLQESADNKTDNDSACTNQKEVMHLLQELMRTQPEFLLQATEQLRRQGLIQEGQSVADQEARATSQSLAPKTGFRPELSTERHEVPNVNSLIPGFQPSSSS